MPLLPCSAVVNMETEFLNLGLDIIGLGVFNFSFNSLTTESPVIKAVYGVLKGENTACMYVRFFGCSLHVCQLMQLVCM